VQLHNNKRFRMSYWGFGRGRGRGYGRRGGSQGGPSQGFGYGPGQGFGRGMGPNQSPFCRQFPDRPRGWWANPTYSNPIPTQYPQQEANQYQYMQPPAYLQSPQPPSHPQFSLQGFATHTNCVHFSNGLCTLRGAAVPANGPACPSFTPATW
jgi:hypothetical protein